MFKQIWKLDFKFEPITKYEYSGERIEYLRKALEKKFNKTLDQLAKELIFGPLKMNDTVFFWSKKTDESKFAIGYNNKGIAYETQKIKQQRFTNAQVYLSVPDAKPQDVGSNTTEKNRKKLS